jgi:hypothetical protein
MHALHALLLVSTLVLRSGDRIAVDAPPKTENGVVVFRSGGVLYSLPEHEIDAEATKTLATAVEKKEEPTRRFRVSDEERRRLLSELERNHAGTAMPVPLSLRQAPPPEPSTSREEWDWRRQARDHEEAVRQAREEFALIEDEIAQLRREIHSFWSQGYKPHQFTYQTTRLAYATERVPRAQLEVNRAERAYDQFRDDARRQGVLPGWLR